MMRNLFIQREANGSSYRAPPSPSCSFPSGFQKATLSSILEKQGGRLVPSGRFSCQYHSQFLNQLFKTTSNKLSFLLFCWMEIQFSEMPSWKWHCISTPQDMTLSLPAPQGLNLTSLEPTSWPCLNPIHLPQIGLHYLGSIHLPRTFMQRGGRAGLVSSSELVIPWQQGRVRKI